MPSAKQHGLCTRVKPRVIFTLEAVASFVLIDVTERMYILILGRPTSPRELGVTMRPEKVLVFGRNFQRGVHVSFKVVYYKTKVYILTVFT